MKWKKNRFILSRSSDIPRVVEEKPSLFFPRSSTRRTWLFPVVDQNNTAACTFVLSQHHCHPRPAKYLRFFRCPFIIIIIIYVLYTGKLYYFTKTRSSAMRFNFDTLYIVTCILLCVCL